MRDKREIRKEIERIELENKNRIDKMKGPNPDPNVPDIVGWPRDLEWVLENESSSPSQWLADDNGDDYESILGVEQ